MDDDFLGLLGGGDFGLLDDVHDGGRGFGAGLLGHGLDELALGLLGGHAGDVLELGNALVVDLLHFGLAHVEGLDLLVEVLAYAFELVALLLQLVDLLREGLLALFEFVLLLAELVVLFVDAFVVFAFELEELLLGLELFLFLEHLAFLFGVLEYLLAACEEFVTQHTGGEPDGDACSHDESNDNPQYFHVCVDVLLLWGRGWCEGVCETQSLKSKSCILLFPPGVMVNSRLLGFERRVYQPYNLPTPEPTRFVNGVEFTNCFGSDAGFVP